MMDKKSENLKKAAQNKEKLIAQLEQQLADAKRAKAVKDRAYHTHQICEMGGTTMKYLIDPDLLTKAELDELMEFAFSKPDVQARLKEILRAHGWVDEAEESTGYIIGTPGKQIDMTGLLDDEDG